MTLKYLLKVNVKRAFPFLQILVCVLYRHSICWILPSVLGGLPRQLEGLRSYSDLSFQEHVQSPTDSRASFATWSDSVRAAPPYCTSLPERKEEREFHVPGICRSHERRLWATPTSWNPENHMKQNGVFPYCLLITLSAQTFKSQHSPFFRQTWDKNNKTWDK